jgi:hypothetical protein
MTGIGIIGTIVGLIFGGYILFAGRRAIWATLGVTSLVVSSRLLAVIVANVESGRDLIEFQEWTLVGIAIVIGILGLTVGWISPRLGVLLIGFLAGADLALWFYEISSYVIVTVAQLSEQLAFVIGVLVIIIGGLFGLWLVGKARDEALILITMLIGVQLIQEALSLNPNSSWTAILIITLGLAGILTQYAIYLREFQESQTAPEPHASSIAYFQDLELDS